MLFCVSCLHHFLFFLSLSSTHLFPHPSLYRSCQGFMHMKFSQCKDGKFVLGQNSPPFDTIPEAVHFYTTHKLPIRGAEHLSLLFPVQVQTLWLSWTLLRLKREDIYCDKMQKKTSTFECQQSGAAVCEAVKTHTGHARPRTSQLLHPCQKKKNYLWINSHEMQYLNFRHICCNSSLSSLCLTKRVDFRTAAPLHCISFTADGNALDVSRAASGPKSAFCECTLVHRRWEEGWFLSYYCATGKKISLFLGEYLDYHVVHMFCGFLMNQYITVKKMGSPSVVCAAHKLCWKKDTRFLPSPVQFSFKISPFLVISVFLLKIAWHILCWPLNVLHG